MIKQFCRWLRDLFSWRCLLSYDDLIQLIDDGVIDAPKSAVKGTTIDLTLHHIVKREAIDAQMQVVRLYKGESIAMVDVDINQLDNKEIIQMPDAIMLGSTNEYFRMPGNLSAEISLKSTLARNFVGHQLAGWIDPYFHGRITLEITNDTQFKKQAYAAGMPICQVKFFRHRWVKPENGYATHGQYNGQNKVTSAGILK